MKKTSPIKVLLIVVMLLIAVLAIDFFFQRHYTEIKAHAFNKGSNGLYVKYPWYFEEKNQEELFTLIDKMKSEQITRAYFHAREVDKDGKSTKPSGDKAKNITKVMHERHPDAKSIAWITIGDKYTPGSDLSKAEFRQSVVEECGWLTGECGFQGVQIDYDPCPTGDQNLLALLKEVREKIGADKYLSVATSPWSSDAEGYWTKEYYAEVAQRCDEVAVRCYDKSMPHPRLYSSMVAQQAKVIPETVSKANPNCAAMMCLPTFPGNLIHNQSENLFFGLKGVTQGLSEAADTKGFEGIALFADNTMDPEEWQDYEKYWLGNAK
jgi:hypothetical protein